MLRAGGKTRTPGRRGEAGAGASGGAGKSGRARAARLKPTQGGGGGGAPRACAERASAPLPPRRAFPGCLGAAPPSAGRRPRLGRRRRERSARGPAPNEPASSLILARGLEGAAARAPLPSPSAASRPWRAWGMGQGPVVPGLPQWSGG